MKSSQIPNFMKICIVGAELYHADEQTYMTKLTVVFRNSADALKFGFRRFNFLEFSCSVMEEFSVGSAGCQYSRTKMHVVQQNYHIFRLSEILP